MRIDPPFNMIIVGMTRCGKTHYILKKLESDYKGCFEYIFLICPSYPWNKTYHEWKYINDKKIFPIPCKQDQVDSFIEYVVDNLDGTTNSPIILDDCAQGPTVKGFSNNFIDLAYSGRRKGFSTIVITQQFHSVSKKYRDNTNLMVTFYNPNYNDMEDFLTECKKVSKGEIEKIQDVLLNNKYSKLEVLRLEGKHEIIYAS